MNGPAIQHCIPTPTDPIVVIAPTVQSSGALRTSPMDTQTGSVYLILKGASEEGLTLQLGTQGSRDHKIRED